MALDRQSRLRKNATMNKGHLAPGQSVLVLLIAEYVGRQELVLDVMRDYRPDWLAKDRAERQRIQEGMKRPPSSGRWDADRDWRFWFHGIGCQLVHTVTREPIEWDLTTDEDGNPLVSSFDGGWFLNWLQWRVRDPRRPIQSQPGRMMVNAMLKNCFDYTALDALEAKHVLRKCRQHGHAYELVKPG